MQDEVNTKVVAIALKGGKVTGEVLNKALISDTTGQPPRYLVFFKGRDVDVMTQAFKEFSTKSLTKRDKPSLLQKLSRHQEQSKKQQREKVKVKSKDRGVEL